MGYVMGGHKSRVEAITTGRGVGVVRPEGCLRSDFDPRLLQIDGVINDLRSPGFTYASQSEDLGGRPSGEAGSLFLRSSKTRSRRISCFRAKIPGMARSWRASGRSRPSLIWFDKL